MHRLVRPLFVATAGLMLAAGVAASPADAAARSPSAAPHVHGTETSMPGMDHSGSMPGMNHDVSPMPDMPGMDHGKDGDVSRPRALVLGGFGGLNGAVLVTALVLRRRTRRHRR